MNTKEIGIYNKDNALIETYPSLTKLCKEKHISEHTMRKCLDLNILHRGFYYRYTGNIIKKEKKVRKNNIQNVCFDSSLIKNFDKWEERICPICHKVFYARKKYNKITCSQECYEKYILENKDSIKEKRINSLKDFYKNQSQEEKERIINKIKQTCLIKYGVDSYQKTEKSRKETSIKYKAKDWSERSIRNKSILIPKYAEICKEDNLELLEFKNRFNCKVRCNKCGTIFNVHVLGYLTEKTNKNLCRICHPIIPSFTNSQPSIFVENILKEHNIAYIKNNRTIIYPYEIDILIPELKIGFEINENYWHSEIAGAKDKKYHINKTIQAYNNGYKLIHIFEDEIVSKPNIVKSRILNLIGRTPTKIGARKCIVQEIDNQTKSSFLNENHIDGDSVSKINLGLFYNDVLVTVATFGKRQISSKIDFELIRFANKINYSVVGGFSKLLSYFKKKYPNQEIITYADIRWSGIDNEHNVYTKNGFIFDRNTTPNYYYVDKTNYLIRLNRMNFTKSKLKKKGIYQEDLTESQIMFNNNFDRLWDCGSMKFILKY